MVHMSTSKHTVNTSVTFPLSPDSVLTTFVARVELCIVSKPLPENGFRVTPHHVFLTTKRVGLSGEEKRVCLRP